MLITGLFHLAIRTADLETTIAFYTRVLGLKEVPRPTAIKFPGAWLAVPTPGGQAVIHVYAGSAATDPDGAIPIDNESGVADHLSLSAHGFLEFREKFKSLGITWREQNNGGSNWQMFVHDPNGLKVELTFEQSAEPGLPAPIPDVNRYKAAERFFSRDEYARAVE
ncbi:MAG: glyoxalase [Herminiimonas sp.]|jgi:catechol 2,3-dioxygenase-like lactoylglutathione lyase family enzyme|nr:glyoxalase [Herminiimonas sp.]